MSQLTNITDQEKTNVEEAIKKYSAILDELTINEILVLCYFIHNLYLESVKTLNYEIIEGSEDIDLIK